jgi:hypothetical protein
MLGGVGKTRTNDLLGPQILRPGFLVTVRDLGLAPNRAGIGFVMTVGNSPQAVFRLFLNLMLLKHCY